MAESHLARLTRHWPGAIFQQRADFSIASADAKFEALTGFPLSAEAKPPHRFWELVHEADVEELQRQCRLATQTPGGVTTTYRVRHALTGKLAYVQEHREAVLSESAELLHYQVLWLEVTRRALAEQRLSAAAWKATFSAATAGLAHDFNNQMAGVLALSDLLLTQSAAEDPKRPALELIQRSATQSAQLLKRLVNLHRGKTGVRQYADLNQVVSETAELVGKVLSRRIGVTTELAPGQLPVYLDAVAFGQVVLNLALNAAEVMPNGGTLLLRATAHTTAPQLQHYRGSLPRLPCACFSMQDSGTGIAPAHLPCLFEPFFSTKPTAKGCGLGLYQSRRFVEKHGGAIAVESAIGAGTTFSLWLPQADFTEAEALATESALRPLRLLLVGRAGAAMEDAAQFLRTHNFIVVATHTPERAIDLLSEEAESLHGVFISSGPGDAALLALVPALHEQKLTSRVVLEILGGEVARVDQAIRDKAHLVLAGREDERIVVQKLQSLFAAKCYM